MIRNAAVVCYFIYAAGSNGIARPYTGIRTNAGPGDGAETFRPYTLRLKLFFNIPNTAY